MTKKATQGNITMCGAHAVKALRTVLFACLCCMVLSCSKDNDDVSYATMSKFYVESRNLNNCDIDSVVHFNEKFTNYLNSHPQAKSCRYYLKTRLRIFNRIKELTETAEND